LTRLGCQFSPAGIMFNHAHGMSFQSDHLTGPTNRINAAQSRRIVRAELSRRLRLYFCLGLETNASWGKSSTVGALRKTLREGEKMK
jgi:hypothetical protein